MSRPMSRLALGEWGEDNNGGDNRTGERAATGFVQTGDGLKPIAPKGTFIIEGGQMLGHEA